MVDRDSNQVIILLGKGDGTFTLGQTITLVDPSDPEDPFIFPDAIVAGNFTSSGHLDLAVAEPFINAVTVLLGHGDGTFTRGHGHFRLDVSSAEQHVARGRRFSRQWRDRSGCGYRRPRRRYARRASGQRQRNLPVPDRLRRNLPRLWRRSGGSRIGYVHQQRLRRPGYGRRQRKWYRRHSVFLGNGQGAFQPAGSSALGGSGGSSTAIATGDFAGNGRTDLAITRTDPDSVQVVLSNDDGTFSSPSAVDLVRPETPLVADLNGDGALDVSVVDAAGDILFRAGEPGEPGVYAPPVTVNPGDPSRAIAFVSTEYGPAIASVDANDDDISFFVLRPTGPHTINFVKVATLATGSDPAQILAADLSGVSGLTDLVVRDAGDGTILVFPNNGSGWFRSPHAYSVGVGASDIEVADLQQNGRLDIVYTDRIAGEVGVLENLGADVFAPPVPYHAGYGPYGVTGTASPSPVSSLEGTTTVAIGTFSPDAPPSLVALNPGSDTMGVLSGLGDGLLSNPAAIPTPSDALVVRAIDFGDGQTGLAVLTSQGLFIYRSNGQGGFLPPTELSAGFDPNGLMVADLNGNSDLLVSNPLGDVLVLMGNGDGTFQPVRNLDQQVSLAVYAPNGSSPAAFIFTNQLTDQLLVQTVGGGISVLGDASTGLITPGAVTLADLNNNGFLDLIVANTGSNNILVYPGLGNGQFGPAMNDGHGFFTGTNPVSTHCRRLDW